MSRYTIDFDDIGGAMATEIVMYINGLPLDGWIGYDESGDLAWSHPFLDDTEWSHEDFANMEELLGVVEAWAQNQTWNVEYAT